MSQILMPINHKIIDVVNDSTFRLRNIRDPRTKTDRPQDRNGPGQKKWEIQDQTVWSRPDQERQGLREYLGTEYFQKSGGQWIPEKYCSHTRGEMKCPKKHLKGNFVMWQGTWPVFKQKRTEIENPRFWGF